MEKRIICIVNGGVTVIIPAYNDRLWGMGKLTKVIQVPYTVYIDDEPVEKMESKTVYIDETEEEYLARVIDRNKEDGIITGEYFVCDESDIPAKDRFRSAWEIKDGKPSISIDKAKSIHMSKIRADRDAELSKLDIDYIRADESGDSALKSDISSKKQALRYLPGTIDLSGPISDWP